MCGKTTVGKALAEKMARCFIDTDQRIIQAYAKETGKLYVCRQIYKTEGEEKFRVLESQQVELLKNDKDCVIAVGGGCLTKERNRQILQKIGNIIYLKTDPRIILERMKSHGCPAFINASGTFSQMIDDRIPIYESTANVVIDTENFAIEEIIENITKRFGREV